MAYTKQQSRVVQGSLVVTVLFILYVTLFPFDFVISSPASLFDFVARLEKSLIPEGTPLDFVLNILLFVPWGYLLAALGNRRMRRRRACLAVGFLTSFLFSTGIEFTQDWLLLRHATLADVIANTVGGGVGASLNLVLGDTVAHQLRALQAWARYSLRIRHYLLLWVAYMAVLLFISSHIQTDALVRGWETTYPLLVGNERTGNRSWQGRVSNLLVANQALAPSSVAAIFAGDPLPEMPDGVLLSLYPLTNAQGNADMTGNLPDLVWRGSSRYLGSDASGAVVGTGQWLETETAVTPLINGIMDRSEFTVSIVAAPAVIKQSGPARIVSISTDTLFRNLTLGQEDDDLVFRFRMPFSDENGRKPELILPDVFADGQPHHLVVTYDKTAVHFYIDTVQNQYSFGTAPSTLLFWYLTPTEATQIRLNAFSPMLFKSLYASLWIVPTGILVFLIWWGRGSRM